MGGVCVYYHLKTVHWDMLSEAAYEAIPAEMPLAHKACCWQGMSLRPAVCVFADICGLADNSKELSAVVILLGV